MAAADVWFEFNVAYILYTDARDNAVDAGCRHACYGGMDVEMLVRTIGRVDTPVMNRLGDKLRALSEAATKMRVTTPLGADFTAMIDKDPAPYLGQRKPGQGYSQMLGGQSGFAALPDSINGTMVFDGTVWPPDEVGIPKTPVELTWEDGRITAIEGGSEARVYKRWLAGFEHEMMYRIAHISYGFNPGVKRLSGRIVEDERVFGCINIGIGPTRLGAPTHTDGVMLNASVWADDDQLEDEGAYVHPELAALCRELGVPGY